MILPPEKEKEEIEKKRRPALQISLSTIWSLK